MMNGDSRRGSGCGRPPRRLSSTAARCRRQSSRGPAADASSAGVVPARGSAADGGGASAGRQYWRRSSGGGASSGGGGGRVISGVRREQAAQRRRRRLGDVGERPAAAVPARGRPAAPARQRRGSGGDAVNGAVARYRPVRNRDDAMKGHGVIIAWRSRRSPACRGGAQLVTEEPSLSRRSPALQSKMGVWPWASMALGEYGLGRVWPWAVDWDKKKEKIERREKGIVRRRETEREKEGRVRETGRRKRGRMMNGDSAHGSIADDLPATLQRRRRDVDDKAARGPAHDASMAAGVVPAHGSAMDGGGASLGGKKILGVAARGGARSGGGGGRVISGVRREQASAARRRLGDVMRGEPPWRGGLRREAGRRRRRGIDVVAAATR
ncbi:hypothetical protein Scep_029385 [Stephania cephalantha]|uniref:Uncharacterized protein n=1 Tax=Stephania cephalantha TaxID=152367 RepID=A0AAP0E581_9MAGN